MEPKTIIIILCVALFVASITIIVQLIWHNDKTGFLFDVIHKLNKENSRLNVELDITAEQLNKQSKRIAELIELCDKLHPDLVESDFDYPKKCIDLVNKRLAFHLNYIDRRFKSDNSEETKEKWTHNFTLKEDSSYKKMMDALHGYTPKVVDNIVFKEIKTVDKSKIKIEEPDE